MTTSRCECCGRQAMGCCSGLDVSQLNFCDAHLDEHAQMCPEIKAGRAWFVRFDPPPGPVVFADQLGEKEDAA